jgi:hypothetical protein
MFRSWPSCAERHITLYATEETELDAYFAVADRAAMQRENGYHEGAGRNQTLAEMGYATLQRYVLERMYTKHLSGEDLRVLESKLKVFRQRLDELQGLNRQKTAGEFAGMGTSTDRAFGVQPIQAHQLTNQDASSELAAATPDHQSVAALAYQLWHARGCPVGSPELDWFCAEEILRRRYEPKSVAA